MYIVGVVRVFELILPIVMIYGLFVRRVIDLGFAINRAPVFTAVSLVALRAWHEPLDLHTVQSEIHGEYAFPMSARGILLGALVVQAKKSGESYAPDELDALKTLAHGTGSALDSLVHSQNGSADAVLEAIRSLADLIRSLDATVQRLQCEQAIK